MNSGHIIKRPIALTEKAAAAKEENKVVFEVALKANKVQIRNAVEELFDVDVVEVNTLVQRGKVKRVYANYVQETPEPTPSYTQKNDGFNTGDF